MSAMTVACCPQDLGRSETIASKDLQDIDTLVARVSASTGLSDREISEQLETADITSFRFDDLILISLDDFDFPR